MGGKYAFESFTLYGAAQRYNHVVKAANWVAYKKPAEDAIPDVSYDNTNLGFSGQSFLIGAQVPVTDKLLFLSSFQYQDAYKVQQDGERVDGTRMVLSGAFEYFFTKRTIAYTNLSYSHGSDGMASDALAAEDVADINRTTLYVGLLHKF